MSIISCYAQKNSANAEAPKLFKVVLDAGHGGYDPGSEGKTSNCKDEKYLTLEMVKKLGQQIKARMPEIEVVYTRRHDVYLKLEDRVGIAEEENADVFLSIHCNSNPKKVIYGTQMHIHSNEARSSKKLAQHLDKAFQNVADRKSLGIFTTKDRGFPLFVLKNTEMPSVLIETGFLSNPEEEIFLNSQEGQTKIVEAVLHGLTSYFRAKNHKITLLPIESEADERAMAKVNSKAVRKLVTEIEEATKRLEKVKQEAEKEEAESNKKYKIVYKVQISSAITPIPNTHWDFEQLKKRKIQVEEVVTEGDARGRRYRYFAGKTETLEQAQQLLQEVKKYNFKDAFITSFEQEIK
ncbi:MAG: N-acetylmuramoyl-L-alanine amidase family protein [Thermoflexibacteraceae bacterium]